MIEVDGLKISINRGDTGSITVTFTGEDVPETGTRVKFGLQKTLDSEEPIWEKIVQVDSGRITIPFYREDTDHARGDYLWYVKILYGNGDVYTPMKKPLPFVILPGGVETPGGDDGG